MSFFGLETIQWHEKGGRFRTDHLILKVSYNAKGLIARVPRIIEHAKSRSIAGNVIVNTIVDVQASCDDITLTDACNLKHRIFKSLFHCFSVLENIYFSLFAYDSSGGVVNHAATKNKDSAVFEELNRRIRFLYILEGSS